MQFVNHYSSDRVATFVSARVAVVAGAMAPPPEPEPKNGRWHQLLNFVALYDSPKCDTLATEATSGRWFRLFEKDDVARELAEKVRSISHWSPYDRVRVVNADP